MPVIPIRMTRIVATLGPASAELDVLEGIIEAGVNVVRLNFAHGDYESHAALIDRVRAVAEETGDFVAVLQDLAGPKLRLRMHEGKAIDIRVGQQIRVVRVLDEDCSADCVATSHPEIVDDCAKDDVVLFGDGAVRMHVLLKTPDHLVLEADHRGRLEQGMGVNLPDTDISVPTLTEKDWRDLEWGIEHEVDYVGLSFVRSPDDVRAVKDRLAKAGSEAKVVAKIEKPQAVERIDEIIEAADALMVARGDLGVEMDVARVPIIQKDLIRRAARAGVPVITATQMLQSMVDSPRPTRAEVSDVANAVFDGSDAVMLSGETAIGKYPVEAVDTMDHVIDLAEDYMDQARWPTPPPVGGRYVWAERAIVIGAARIASDLGVKLAVALSHSGKTALLLSKQWLGAPILGISDRVDTCRRMALYRSVIPCYHPEMIGHERLVERVERLARDRDLVGEGDRILIISGQFPGQPGGTDTLRVHTVPAREGEAE